MKNNIIAEKLTSGLVSSAVRFQRAGCPSVKSRSYERKNLTMEKTAVQCPKCSSLYVVKNGSIANGKKKFLCKECSRQFVEHHQSRQISDAGWRTVDRLLLENLHDQASQEQFPYQKDGFRNMLKKRDEVRRQAFRMSKDGKIFIVSGRRDDAGVGLPF